MFIEMYVLAEVALCLSADRAHMGGPEVRLAVCSEDVPWGDDATAGG